MKALKRKGTTDRWGNVINSSGTDRYFLFTDNKPHLFIDEEEYNEMVDKILFYCGGDLDEFDLIDIEIKQL